jgi:hypothetical protein
MSSPILILTSYVVNNKIIRGSFPIYVLGISQCCIKADGTQKVTPIVINPNKIQK